MFKIRVNVTLITEMNITQDGDIIVDQPYWLVWVVFPCQPRLELKTAQACDEGAVGN
jgi:hypothetical protein